MTRLKGKKRTTEKALLEARDAWRADPENTDLWKAYQRAARAYVAAFEGR